MCGDLAFFYPLDNALNRVMRLVVWGGVGGYERCMTSCCMREHCLFLTVETLPLCSVSRMCCWNVCGAGLCVLSLYVQW